MLIVQFDDLPDNPSTIESMSQYVDAGGRHDQPEIIYFFVWIDDANHVTKCERAKEGPFL